jgi:sulfane dehydrogenase subunit SoxC
MGSPIQQQPGQVRKAPENFVDAEGVRTVFAQAQGGRRDFIRNAFAAAVAGTAASSALAQSPQQQPRPADGDPAILQLPAHSTGLGQAVVTDGYGKPSKYEANVQRRQSPGLTPTRAGLGVVRAAAVAVRHRHAQRPALRAAPPGLVGHRSVEAPPDDQRHGEDAPKVFTLDELMRLPSVSRFHFIECGANTGMEWGNVAVPTVQYTHGMLSCSEFTGVPLITLLELAGADLKGAASCWPKAPTVPP